MKKMLPYEKIQIGINIFVFLQVLRIIYKSVYPLYSPWTLTRNFYTKENLRKDLNLEMFMFFT